MTFPLDVLLAGAEVAAPRMVGAVLESRGSGVVTRGRIVETEAYPGGSDLASHTSGGRRTPRTESMYLEGGHAYVYRIYGIHDCVNVVSGVEGSGEAVLIRALVPDEGIESIRRSRPGVSERDLLRGPGRLCRGLSIDRSLDALRFGEGPLRLGPAPRPGPVVAATRIGIDRAGEWALRPWRFLAGEPRWWSVRP